MKDRKPNFAENICRILSATVFLAPMADHENKHQQFYGSLWGRTKLSF